MRILLLQYAPYFPVRGGANKSNVLLLEALTQLGCECQAIASVESALGIGGLVNELSKIGAPVVAASETECEFRLRGVHVFSGDGPGAVRCVAQKKIQEWTPDWLLVSSEDFAQSLLRAAVESGHRRIAYLARTAMALPFGPAAYSANQRGLELVRSTSAVLTMSRFMKTYVEAWAGVEATVLPISLFDPGPYEEFGDFDTGHIAMVNPCALKGIGIFAEVAKRLPSRSFATVAGWGTTTIDVDLLKSIGNVHVGASTCDMRTVYSRTRVLMAPSLWTEAWARVVIEAMAHGIPVVASDSGGLPEAKLGVDYVVPVHPIREFTNRLDEANLPIPIVPEQEYGVWTSIIQELTANRSLYESLSRQSRRKALEFLKFHRADAVLDFLRAKASLSAPAPRSPAALATGPFSAPGIRDMTPEERIRLLGCLKQDRSHPGGPR
jgi:glycosyltransferase involved in cell wall biosynthesis